jgi:type II secretory pathway pseudopilin PulG
VRLRIGIIPPCLAPRANIRAAFTLTELLVAMALVVFIMAILAETFDTSVTTFRQMKRISDMNERLRTTATILRKYLLADHFEGKKRLSDPTFWNGGPPAEGFFRVAQMTPGSAIPSEGVDLDGNNSYRSVDHVLHFSVKLRGNGRGEVFRASVPSGSPLVNGAFGSLYPPDARFQDPSSSNITFCSPWAEVAFFLQPVKVAGVQLTTGPNGGGLPLYTLYLEQKLAVPSNDLFATTGNTVASGTSGYSEISFYDPGSGNNLAFNTPQDLTMPARRMGGGGAAGVTSLSGYTGLIQTSGNDVLLTNVLSFDVRLLTDQNVTFQSISQLGQSGYTLTNNSLISGPAIFDTWSNRADNLFDYGGWATAGANNSIPLYKNTGGNAISVKAIQITIRIWDERTQQTRQTSIIADL